MFNLNGCQIASESADSMSDCSADLLPNRLVDVGLYSFARRYPIWRHHQFGFSAPRKGCWSFTTVGNDSRVEGCLWWPVLVNMRQRAENIKI